MKIGFMSSVCPEQTLPELIATARSYGYEGLEFRVEWGHAHGVELDAPEDQLAHARRQLADAGVIPSCLATSVRFNAEDRAAHLAQRETLRKYIVLARQIGAPVIRTFSDSLPEDDPDVRDRVLRLAAESYAAVDAWAVEHEVTVLVETHTNMKGQWARRILDEAGAQSLQVLWHTGHHLQRGESVDEAWSYIGERVRHVHFTAPSGDNYVTDADNQRMVDLLLETAYDGFLSVEIINPDDPATVLAHHIEKYHQYLGR
jgi:sugar phosphate isomerase/epimerase